MASKKEPIERESLPYAKHWIRPEDIEAVDEVLRSDWLTTGPKVAEFERAVAAFVKARHGVAVSSGTAALHAAMYAADIGPGDEVIVPAITFVATANAVVYQGGTPVFGDVEPDTLLLDPHDVAERITPKTRAIVPVDFAGQPVNYDAFSDLAEDHDLLLLGDSCHALGAEYQGRRIGTLADLTVFSFHPAKHVTTGEGGMVVGDDASMAERMRAFRNHGITQGPRDRMESGTWYYELADLGYNLRITDFQCALGLSQLKRLPQLLDRRQDLAQHYDEALGRLEGVFPLTRKEDRRHANHLYVVRFDAGKSKRQQAFDVLAQKGVSANVHYIPVHLQPFYRTRFGTERGLCPRAEAAYEQILTLPLFPGMSHSDVDYVVQALGEVVASS